MKGQNEGGRAPACDPDGGVWRGHSVARRFVSPDGWIVLVGRTASDNDKLTFKLGAPRDFWLHVAGESGSHVLVRNPAGLERTPRETLRFAASLAAHYSKARGGGRVAVHVCTCSEVYKPHGLPAGKVMLKRFTTVHASPSRATNQGSVGNPAARAAGEHPGAPSPDLTSRRKVTPAGRNSDSRS